MYIFNKENCKNNKIDIVNRIQCVIIVKIMYKININIHHIHDYDVNWYLRHEY